MVTHANIMKGAMRKPIIRTEQPNPREELLSILEMVIGMIMPPMDEPETTTPRAVARFLSKYCDTAAKAGNCKRP